MADVGYDVYKVRLPNPSAQRGKRGGFRVIYYVHVEDHVIIITVYSKTERETILADQIKQAIKSALDEDDDEIE